LKLEVGTLKVDAVDGVHTTRTGDTSEKAEQPMALQAFTRYL